MFGFLHGFISFFFFFFTFLEGWLINRPFHSRHFDMPISGKACLCYWWLNSPSTQDAILKAERKELSSWNHSSITIRWSHKTKQLDAATHFQQTLFLYVLLLKYLWLQFQPILQMTAGSLSCAVMFVYKIFTYCLPLALFLQCSGASFSVVEPRRRKYL